MPDELELERTYLAKRLPEDLERYESKEIVDIYIPESAQHPQLRIRKNGDRFVITKKKPEKEGDSSRLVEQTIQLTREEFDELSVLEGKRLRKIRYSYDYNGRTAEIDIFKDALEGLVLVDFEFDDPKEKDSFAMPDFCLADVTQKGFAAGGLLCGKRYSDIEENLKTLGYSKIVRI